MGKETTKEKQVFKGASSYTLESQVVTFWDGFFGYESKRSVLVLFRVCSKGCRIQLVTEHYAFGDLVQQLTGLRLGK